jgi:hypothetical protein
MVGTREKAPQREFRGVVVLCGSRPLDGWPSGSFAAASATAAREALPAATFASHSTSGIGILHRTIPTVTEQHLTGHQQARRKFMQALTERTTIATSPDVNVYVQILISHGSLLADEIS